MTPHILTLIGILLARGVPDHELDHVLSHLPMSCPLPTTARGVMADIDAAIMRATICEEPR